MKRFVITLIVHVQDSKLIDYTSIQSEIMDLAHKHKAKIQMHSEEVIPYDS